MNLKHGAQHTAYSIQHVAVQEHLWQNDEACKDKGGNRTIASADAQWVEVTSGQEASNYFNARDVLRISLE